MSSSFSETVFKRFIFLILIVISGLWDEASWTGIISHIWKKGCNKKYSFSNHPEEFYGLQSHKLATCFHSWTWQMETTLSNRRKTNSFQSQWTITRENVFLKFFQVKYTNLWFWGWYFYLNHISHKHLQRYTYTSFHTGHYYITGSSFHVLFHLFKWSYLC